MLQPACDCSAQLGGIGTGGWIALSLFIGMFVGSIATLSVQCWRRRREMRYMGKVSSKDPGTHRKHQLCLPAASQ